MKVLSLFNGISCGRLALQRAGLVVDKYVSYEIDTYANMIAKANYPNDEYNGDVFEGDFTKYNGFDLLIGGSPCTYWSIANKNREIKCRGLGFDLFMQYVRALKETKCKYFLYENNYSISKEIKEEITKNLGVEPIMINSSLVSGQERKRLYWTNIPNVTQPNNKHIYLKDIMGLNTQKQLQDNIVMSKDTFMVKVRKHDINTEELSLFLKTKKKESNISTKTIANECGVPVTKAEHWFRTDSSFSIPDENVWYKLKDLIGIKEDTYDKQIMEFEFKETSYDMAKRVYDICGKSPTLTTATHSEKHKNITDGNNFFYLEPIHCERLQTLPDDFTKVNGVSCRQRYKCIGNGWTVDVVTHILKNIK